MKIDPNASKKAAEAAKKGWVTGGFQWPDKKVEVGFESTGSKELDAEDASEGRAPDAAPAAVSAALPAAASATAPATSSFGSTGFAFGSSVPSGGNTPISSAFSFGDRKSVV